ncbi:hypothetical protein CEXT_137361 [Caerostris extrusa]|uniref:Uncharacterized protein n=1 Tax=Caerostris extrusa TaxID=172846 RepID=A0AAV4WIU0_CAEEX|nr:hypothetical protein CEXT_137361 [Caerostris extrusa]
MRNLTSDRDALSSKLDERDAEILNLKEKVKFMEQYQTGLDCKLAERVEDIRLLKVHLSEMNRCRRMDEGKVENLHTTRQELIKVAHPRRHRSRPSPATDQDSHPAEVADPKIERTGCQRGRNAQHGEAGAEVAGDGKQEVGGGGGGSADGLQEGAEDQGREEQVFVRAGGHV